MGRKSTEVPGTVYHGLTLLRQAGPYWAFRCPVCGGEGQAGIWSIRNGKLKSCGCIQKNPHNDLTGKVFGRLTVLRYERPRWVCRCECGKEHRAMPAGLMRGATQSCGCVWPRVEAYHASRTIDETGKRYGRLYVLGPAKMAGRRGAFWRCQCDCGEETIVQGGVLRYGGIKSCGCNHWPIGEDHHCYRHDITKGSRKRNQLERGFSALHFSPMVFQRDGWTCSKCGGCEHLHAHHILPWRDYPGERFDLNNAVTLCRKCHAKLHAPYRPGLPGMFELLLFLGETK